MAQITIQSNPASMSTKVVYGNTGSTWTARATKQIVNFNLSVLGKNPVITGASLRAYSTGEESYRDMSHDTFLITYANKYYSFSVNESVDLTEAVRNALGAGSMDVTTAYYGYFAGPQLSPTTQTAVVSYTLTVETEGEISTDTRSDGTLSADSVSLGGTIRMTITPLEQYRDAYSHRVTWAVGGYSTDQTLSPGQTTASLTVPTSWANAITNTAIGTLEVTLDTLSDGESVGTRTYTAAVLVPDTNAYRPTVGQLSASAVNTGALDGNSQYFAGASRIALSLAGASGAAGSTIVSIVYSGWGESITTTALNVTTNVIQRSGTVQLQAVATDSRGRTATATLDIPVVQYDPPYFEEGIVAERWNTEEERPGQDGNAVHVRATFGCSTAVFPDNTARAYAAIRERGARDWSNETELTSGEDAFVTDLTLDKMKAYELYLRVSDNVMVGRDRSVYVYITLSSSQYLLHFSNNGHAIGVGQEAQELAPGEIGRIDINPDWNIYIGAQRFSGSDLTVVLNALIRDVQRLRDSVEQTEGV